MQKIIISKKNNNWQRPTTFLQVPPRSFKSKSLLPPSELHFSAKKLVTCEEQISMLLNHEKRLSLAYGALEEVPPLILQYIAEKIQILDLSHNHFRNLSFLKHFPNLQTLILDKNSNLDCHTLPQMKSLEIIWLNNCNIINVSDWLITLQVQCPVLKQLSMMCNPVGWTLLNGVSEHDEKEYLKQILKILPNLEHFDCIRITDELRQSAIGRKNLPLNFIEWFFCKKFISFVNFSAKFQSSYMSLDKLNVSFSLK